MRLDEVVRQLDSLDRDTIVCVRQPWTPSSECCLTPPLVDLGVPSAVTSAGFEYFLEVHIALEALEVFEHRTRRPTDDEKARLLVYYATHDAFPDWVYDD